MGEISLRRALDDYKIIYMPYRNFAERTRAEYQNDLEGFVRYLHSAGIVAISSVGLPIIQRYAAWLEENGYADVTRKRKLVAVRSFLLFLYQDGFIRSNIAALITLPFVENRGPHILTQREIRRLELVSRMGNPRDFAIVEAALHTGIRLGELTRLSQDDINIEGAVSWIRVGGSRGGVGRIVPLNTAVAIALRNYRRTCSARNTHSLFLNRFGLPLGQRGVQKILSKYLRAAGIRRASIHALRHTFGAALALRGETDKSIRELMGLKDGRQTAIYLHAANCHRR